MAAFYEERARGGVGLIVAGGIAPNNAGRVAPFAAMMTSPSDAARHKEVVAAVHQHHDAAGNGPRNAMQILHAGRPHQRQGAEAGSHRRRCPSARSRRRSATLCARRSWRRRRGWRSGAHERAPRGAVQPVPGFTPVRCTVCAARARRPRAGKDPRGRVFGPGEVSPNPGPAACSVSPRTLRETGGAEPHPSGGVRAARP